MFGNPSMYFMTIWDVEILEYIISWFFIGVKNEEIILADFCLEGWIYTNKKLTQLWNMTLYQLYHLTFNHVGNQRNISTCKKEEWKSSTKDENTVRKRCLTRNQSGDTN